LKSWLKVAVDQEVQAVHRAALVVVEKVLQQEEGDLLLPQGLTKAQQQEGSLEISQMQPLFVRAKWVKRQLI
jgi:hypothetical protein